ncbi:iron-hydroxamate transporter permease subunit [Nocardioides flavus (ex Wang et al. 2016)]|uniref:Iron-hydroxamate transporter permease subunit n=1 Tax=Nocardioides flavus (ex Wang et al. 2016) TaxID=2058780 RepID=A0ABQ3HP84_9ACTN|nr:iron ABC transporter permease [Nocardioides flavus (ex Wang et al. 2016)]GHE19346.1 iron-hydroxamate transporter permease subunit [Nocardioides flavus (ex Wang et al. 2016)]
MSIDQRRPARAAPAGAVPTAEDVVPRPGHAARLGSTGVLLALLAGLALVSGWHLTQGTSAVGLRDLVGLLVAPTPDDAGVRDVLAGSRMPRLAAGLAVGFALGVAGALLQSVSRNALASPDTLAVTAGASFAVTAVAAFGLAVPLWGSTLVAFAGGLLAASLVLVLAGGAGTSTTRLVLAGSATAMALGSATAGLLVLFRTETTGLFAWGNGSLNQLDLRAFLQAAPLIGLATLAALLASRRLDLLGLGDDTASVLGVPVRSTRVVAVVLGVLLSAAAVTMAGPIGFVGLCAPAAARLLGRVVPSVLRHRVLVLAAGLLGALLVVGADLAMRAVLGADRATVVPTGVTTTLLGALVLVVLARGARDSGPTRRPPSARVGVHGRARFVVVLVVGTVLVVAVVLGGLLLGYTRLRSGDLVVWARGDAPSLLSFVMDERAPRVLAALLGGAGLALAGSLVQATCRNPLAEPGILGIAGGAGVGAVLVVTLGSGSRSALVVAAVLGALIAFALVYAVSWRHGLDSDRLVLVGVGVSALAGGVSTFLLLRADPYDTPAIFTWLSGTTYGRTWAEVVPVAVALAVVLPIAVLARRELDLLSLDEDTPRVVGVGTEKVRLTVLVAAAVITALSVTAVGVVGFVGLVAPHAARGLVGARNARVVPVAVLVGAALLAAADAVGRTALAPADLPAGLVVALVGGPYFVYLLARSRA